MKKLAVAASLALTFAMPVSAQQIQCGPLDKVYELIAEKYQESRVGLGLSGPGLVEVWVNSDTGTFTILGVLPSGVGCVLATGIGFEFQEDNYKLEPNL
jgi:hypothetical protein